MQPKMDSKLEVGKNQQPEVKTTLKRFIVLFLFALNNGNKSFQAFSLSANTKKVAFFYGVDNYVINGTSGIFFLAILVLVIPSCFVNEKFGLRNSMLISSVTMAIGSTIKCFSCHEAGIEILFLGLTFASLGSTVVQACGGRVACVWFPNEEISTAAAINMLGYNFGLALGFLLPQYLLHEIETKDGIGAVLLLVYQTNALVSVLALVATYIFFDEAPKYPPSQARLKQIQHEAMAKEYQQEEQRFSSEITVMIEGFAKLIRDGNFILLLISYSLSEAVLDSMNTVLNQMLGSVWPNDELRVGYVGSIMIVAGLLTTPFIGRILDKWRRYKLTYLMLTMGILASSILFGVLFKYYPVPWAIYLTAALFGACGSGIMAAGPEVGIEITYPTNEVVMWTLVKLSVGVFALFTIMTASWLSDTFGHMAAILFFVVTSGTIAAMVLCMRENLYRQNAAKQAQIPQIKQ